MGTYEMVDRAVPLRRYLYDPMLENLQIFRWPVAMLNVYFIIGLAILAKVMWPIAEVRHDRVVVLFFYAGMSMATSVANVLIFFSIRRHERALNAYKVLEVISVVE